MSLRPLITAFTLCLNLGYLNAWADPLNLNPIKNKITSSKIIILGEQHDDPYGPNHYAELVKEIKKVDASYNCLTLEWEEFLQEEFNQLVSNPSPESFREIYPSLFQKIDPESYADSTSTALIHQAQQFEVKNKPWVLAAAEMLELSGKFFTIDSPIAHQMEFEEGLDARNTYMSKKVISLLSSKKCSKVIMINGLAHIIPKFADVDSLLDRLSDHHPLGMEINASSYHQQSSYPKDNRSISLSFDKDGNAKIDL